MRIPFNQRQVALAALAVMGSVALSVSPIQAVAQSKAAGKYVAGDFHNHTTCSDGTLSMQKLVKRPRSPGVWTGLFRPATVATATATAR